MFTIKVHGKLLQCQREGEGDRARERTPLFEAWTMYTWSIRHHKIMCNCVPPLRLDLSHALDLKFG